LFVICIFYEQQITANSFLTPEARLAQVEAILATVAKYIDRHTQAIERNASEIDRLKVKIN
jgi:hypothetical protein